MIRRPPSSTRTDTLFPYTSLFRSGYALRDAVVSDPAHGSVPVDELLSDALADRLRSEVRLDRASAPEAWERHAPVHKETTYLTVVDRDRNAIRSEERRVGKECVSTCRSRWSPYHEKKKTT